MKTQICRTCKESQHLTEKFFHRDKSKETGFATECKVCACAYHNKRVGRPPKVEVSTRILPTSEFDGLCQIERAKELVESIRPAYSFEQPAF